MIICFSTYEIMFGKESPEHQKFHQLLQNFFIATKESKVHFSYFYKKPSF